MEGGGGFTRPPPSPALPLWKYSFRKENGIRNRQSMFHYFATKAKLQKEGIFFLIHLFSGDILF